MIYIISEDNFFALGLIATLKQSEIVATCLSLDELSRIKDSISGYDIILTCSQSRENSESLTHMIKELDAKIIYFIDIALEKGRLSIDHHGLLSKKTKSDELIDFLRNLSNRSRIKSIVFSGRETVIMDLLAEQKDAFRIAKLLNVSVKTVFAHKLNAIKKMGTSHLNARSILLYERIFKTGRYTITL
jgi:DNA-binding CsgD family transcriptional regulator